MFKLNIQSRNEKHLARENPRHILKTSSLTFLPWTEKDAHTDNENDYNTTTDGVQYHINLKENNNSKKKKKKKKTNQPTLAIAQSDKEK